MKTLCLLICCLALNNAYAYRELRPGLWKVSFKIKLEDQVINPAQQMRAVMASMSAQEKEQMRKVIKQESGLDKDGKIEICYPPDALEMRESAVSQMGDSCVSKIIKRTQRKVSSTFVCMDGFRGLTTWFLNSSRGYDGVTKLITPWGEQSEIVYSGKFISYRCNMSDNVVI